MTLHKAQGETGTETTYHHDLQKGGSRTIAKSPCSLEGPGRCFIDINMPVDSI